MLAPPTLLMTCMLVPFAACSATPKVPPGGPITLDRLAFEDVRVPKADADRPNFVPYGNGDKAPAIEVKDEDGVSWAYVRAPDAGTKEFFVLDDWGRVLFRAEPSNDAKFEIPNGVASLTPYALAADLHEGKKVSVTPGGTIPIIQPVLDLMGWGMLFFEVSPECAYNFMVAFDLTNVPCIRLLVTKALSYGIVIGSILIRLPQILQIVTNKSAKGVSLVMYGLELTSYSFALGYNVRQGYEFSSYGECFNILIADVIICGLIMYFNGSRTLLAIYLALYPCFEYLLCTSTIIPMSVVETGYLGAVIFTVVGRTSQILELRKLGAGDTGQVSLLTTMLNTVGSGVRFLTAKDFNICLNFGVTTLINGLLAAQWGFNHFSKPKVQ